MDHAGIEHEHPIDDGVDVQRRALLWLPIFCSSTAALAVGSPIAAEDAAQATEKGASEGAFSPLTREEFGKRWQALTRALELAPAECDESYAAQLAGLLSRVPIDALPRLEKPMGANGIAGGPSWQAVPGITIEFRMQPGARLRLHNHPPQVVLTLCAEGEVGYRHFEVDGEAPPCTRIDGTEFRVRETRSGILRPRQSTSLTRVRDGIHGFVAGREGARIIDFTLSLTEDVATFSYLEVAEKPIDAQRRVYTASWLGKGS